jgi:hypothetical protein
MAGNIVLCVINSPLSSIFAVIIPNKNKFGRFRADPLRSVVTRTKMLGKTVRGNQQWTTQRHWQQWVHKTQEKVKQSTTQTTTIMSNTNHTKNRS